MQQLVYKTLKDLKKLRFIAIIWFGIGPNLLTFNIVFAQFPEETILLKSSSEKPKEKPAVISPSLKKQSTIKTKENSIENPQETNINAEIIEFNYTPENSSGIKSMADIIEKHQTGKVIRYGGEGSALSVRFRGSSAFEPLYYFAEIPLVGAFNGSQNIDLLPANLIMSSEAWPDFVPWNYESAAISGGINFSACPKDNCFKTEKNIPSISTSIKAGSYGFKQVSLYTHNFYTRKYSLISSFQATRSDENYLVTNDNDTTTRTDDDVIQKRTNNDFSRFTSGLHFAAQNIPWLGKVNSNIIFGTEERGLPGQLGSEGNGRLTRSLLLTSLKAKKLYPSSGIILTNNLYFTYENARQTKIPSSKASLTSPKINSLKYGLKSTFVLPQELLIPGSFGVTAAYNYNEQNKYAENDLQILQAKRNEAWFSSIKTWNIPDIISLSSSLSIEGRYNIASSKTLISCRSNNFFGKCENSDIERTIPEENIPMYNVSYQAKNKYFFSYLRYGLAVRRPFLVELYGSNNGITPNLNLLPEKSSKLELGTGTNYLEGMCFLGIDKNLIFLESTSPGNGHYENLQEARRKGCSINANALIFTWWQPSVNWQITSATFSAPTLTTTKVIPRTPLHDISGELAFVNFKSSILTQSEEWNAFIKINKQSKIYLDSANFIQLELPLQFSASLSTKFEFSPSAELKNLLVSIQGYNLSDNRRGIQTDIAGNTVNVEHLGFVGYPSPGRRFYFTIDASF